MPNLGGFIFVWHHQTRTRRQACAPVTIPLPGGGASVTTQGQRDKISNVWSRKTSQTKRYEYLFGVKGEFNLGEISLKLCSKMVISFYSMGCLAELVENNVSATGFQ